MVLHLSLQLFGSVVVMSNVDELQTLEVLGSSLADGAFFAANEQCSAQLRLNTF
jgi:hypothetical protein